LGLIVSFCLSCAGPALTSRVVQQDTTWFVRLDSYQDPGHSQARYEHPAAWTEPELSAILSRLLLEDRVGLMDTARPPRPVFSADEIMLLVPAIRQSFQQARQAEWVSLLLSSPNSSGLTVTSGGMFLAGSRLHIVVANHRTPLARESQELARVRANPFYSVGGGDGSLTFESPKFAMGTRANWSGGHRASASELTLDHQGFLSFLKRSGVMPAALQATDSSSVTSSSEQATPLAAYPASENSDPKSTILRLQDEVERLKKKVQEQEAEIARLKRGAESSSRSTPRP
jgi:hypothetical protein